LHRTAFHRGRPGWGAPICRQRTASENATRCEAPQTSSGVEGADVGLLSQDSVGAQGREAGNDTGDALWRADLRGTVI